jgi:hypothetical protein
MDMSPKSPTPAAGTSTPLGRAIMSVVLDIRDNGFPTAFAKAAA